MNLVIINRLIHAEVLEGLSSGILICLDNNIGSAEKHETQNHNSWLINDQRVGMLETAAMGLAWERRDALVKNKFWVRSVRFRVD